MCAENALGKNAGTSIVPYARVHKYVKTGLAGGLAVCDLASFRFRFLFLFGSRMLLKLFSIEQRFRNLFRTSTELDEAIELNTDELLEQEQQ